MTPELLQTLLRMPEGPELDFKQQPYRFVKTEPEEKSKLLKDLIAFANAWRRSEAYILIGVEEVKGGCGIVHGLKAGDPDAELDDATLQQFVNTRTNRPVEFRYELFPTGNTRVGVFTVAKQRRPVYGVKDYGRVKRHEVYYRQGSSTAIATPDDIARMVEADSRLATVYPMLRVEFADIERRTTYDVGDADLIHHQPHRAADLPSLQAPHRGYGDALVFTRSSTNSDYWRELARYVRMRRTSCSIGLAVTNTSGVLAQNVVARIEVPRGGFCRALHEAEMPHLPKRELRLIDRLPDLAHLRSCVEVEHLEDMDHVTVELGSIAPKRQSFAAEPFYLAAAASRDLTLTITLYADNLPDPIKTELLVRFQVTPMPPLTMEDLEQVDPEQIDQQ